MKRPTDSPVQGRGVQEQAKIRRQRNVAIGVALAVLCLLFYAVTIVKLGPGVLARPV